MKKSTVSSTKPAVPSESRMGELSYPNDSTVYLKPRLLLKRQQLKQERYSGLKHWFVPVSSKMLWCVGFSLLSYPLWVLLCYKYRQDFQQEWHNTLYSQTNTVGHEKMTSRLLFLAKRGLLSSLDFLSLWVIDLCPRIASAIMVLHFGLCLGYAANTFWTGQGLETSIQSPARRLKKMD